MLNFKACKRLLIYGGSFDPPHRGHVDMPIQAMRAIGFDGVVYVPAGLPPHKSRKVTSATHRLTMLRLVLHDRSDAAICTWELDQPGPSYTVDTLMYLREVLGEQVEIRLLIGADMAATFDQWRDPKRVIQLANPLVMMREPYDRDTLSAWEGQIVNVPRVDISSSWVRSAIAAGRWDDPKLLDAMDAGVLHYIEEHHLYQQHQAPSEPS